MKFFDSKSLIILLGIVILVVFFSFLRMQLSKQSTDMNNPQLVSSPASVQPSDISQNPTTPPVDSTKQSGLVNQVNIYMIALEDNGKSGPKIGCNDSVVPVNQAITPTQAPLRVALVKLLSYKSQYFGQSGFYNALYQSNLTVNSVSISDTKATIKLVGTYALGGVCDSPRFKAQLEQTALQFPTIKTVEIFINGTPIDQILSEK